MFDQAVVIFWETRERSNLKAATQSPSSVVTKHLKIQVFFRPAIFPFAVLPSSCIAQSFSRSPVPILLRIAEALAHRHSP